MYLIVVARNGGLLQCANKGMQKSRSLKSTAQFARLQSSPSAISLGFLIPHFVAPRIGIPFFVKSLKGLIFLAVLTNSALAGEVQLESDTDVATAGYFQLRWIADSRIELQESRSADFEAARVVYAGSDAARVISGKPDGDWYYRVAATNGVFSSPVKVTVRHHPVERAFGYFVVGLIVFLTTLLLIISGARDREPAPAVLRKRI